MAVKQIRGINTGYADGSISEGIDMNQKLAVIIGGSSGIGFEIARQPNALGAHLTIVGRDQVKLAAAAKKLGGTGQFGRYA